MVVYGLSEEFLAGAALAAKQDGPLAVGHGPNLREQPLHGLTAGHQPAEVLDVAVESLVGRLIDQHLLEFVQQLLGRKRFGDVVVSAALDGPHRGLDRGVGRHQNHDRVGPLLSHIAQKFDAIHARHAHIGNDHIDRRAVEYPPRGLSVGGLKHFVARLAEFDLQRDPLERLIVDDENACLHALPNLRLRARRNARSRRPSTFQRKTPGDSTPAMPQPRTRINPRARRAAQPTGEDLHR